MPRHHCKWLVHFIAQCQDCNWHNEDYLKGQAEASRHSRRTGHRVEAEEGYAVRYGEEHVSEKEAKPQ